jgi:hypothetical protein
MQSLKYVVVLWIGGSMLGCQKTGDADAPPQQPSAVPEITPVERPVASTDRTGQDVTAADVLDVLGIATWKDNVNGPGQAAVKHVALCVKSPGQEPRTLMELDIDNPGVPGTLLVFLKDGYGPEFEAGMIYHGQHGRDSRLSAPLADPFTGSTGISSNTGARIGSPGIVILMSSTYAGGEDDIETDQSGIVIYLKNE